MILKLFTPPLILSFLIFWPTFATATGKIEPSLKHGLSTTLITKIIEQNHYKKNRLNDEQSNRIFEEYLEALDPGRNIFTQKDLDQFSQFRTALDDALLDGNLEPAYVIFRKFNDRRVERANFALKSLETDFDFSTEESFLFNREELGWPKDRIELDKIWLRKVKNDYLTLLLVDKKEDALKETLRKRYNRIIKRSSQLNAEDVYESFINAYLRTIEPHTAYFSPRTSENFNINMSLSLEGIGAVLQTVEEHTVIKRTIKGGPAELSKQLHAGDKIIGVGQGSGKVEDVIGWRLDDVVQLIRGPKDSVVQLHILPEASGPGGADKHITIVRNKIKLEDQQVKKSIIEIPQGESQQKIGVIEIPTFYMDFAASARGDKDFSSTTRDTQKIIDELKAENVDGIVVDLRRNGGGSLVEAVSLTGLFIESGPIVQIRNSIGNIKVDKDTNKNIAYTGPLAVLVDRHSASASEIFAGAIQDYGRGVILGEPTFGKGTVQTIVDLNNYVRNNEFTLGKLKLTMAQFFRINGDSTQHRGIVPDIIFPTSAENEDQGERALENALPWASVPAAKFSPVGLIPQDFSHVKNRHESRVKKDSGFELLLSQSKRRQILSKKKALSLLKIERKTEREQREKDQNEQLNKFRESRGLKTVSIADDFATDVDNDSEEKTHLSDEVQHILLREAATILVDLSQVSSNNQFTQKKMSTNSKNSL